MTAVGEHGLQHLAEHRLLVEGEALLLPLGKVGFGDFGVDLVEIAEPGRCAGETTRIEPVGHALREVRDHERGPQRLAGDLVTVGSSHPTRRSVGAGLGGADGDDVEGEGLGGGGSLSEGGGAGQQGGEEDSPDHMFLLRGEWYTRGVWSEMQESRTALTMTSLIGGLRKGPGLKPLDSIGLIQGG